jgi:hypothetical protein
MALLDVVEALHGHLMHHNARRRKEPPRLVPGRLGAIARDAFEDLELHPHLNPPVAPLRSAMMRDTDTNMVACTHVLSKLSIHPSIKRQRRCRRERERHHRATAWPPQKLFNMSPAHFGSTPHYRVSE